jgi:hypothetical protein
MRTYGEVLSGFTTTAAMVHRLIVAAPPSALIGGLQTADLQRTRLCAPIDDWRRALVSILEINGDSYRLGQSRARKTQAAAEAQP